MKTNSAAFSVLSASLLVASLALGAGSALAQFAVSGFAIAGGGATRSAGGSFGIGGTIGQADAGRSSGGSYTVSSGFWSGGGGVVAGVEDGEESEGSDGAESPGSAPLAFRMYPASPNPVDDGTVLAFDLPEPRFVRLEVYDVAGRIVRVLAGEVIPAGRNQRAWDRRNEAGVRVPSGIYFLRLNAEPDMSGQKIVLLP